MPTSVPGSNGLPGRRCAATAPRGERVGWGRPGANAALPARRSFGFTLIELMVVMAIVAIASALVVVALPDRRQDRLNEEAERLSALLESARSEARASGMAVRWEPAAADNSEGADFHFIGLPKSSGLPTQWLEHGVSAEIVGARAVTLGPEPVLPPQRIVLRLDDRRVVLATDGLAAFGPVAAGSP